MSEGFLVKSIKEEWADFRVTAIHRDAPPLQVKLMEEAFYAGAISSFNQTIGIANKKNADREVLKIQRELEAYIKNFKQQM